ncbi:hypothetical protein LTR53_010384 [Teratosphaeriaceae sp. CCFEE 6253]|nr:hypothetical protein LTR53_010384 [Teratosphaeriaceae sp. CCFEE 6253]
MEGHHAGSRQPSDDANDPTHFGAAVDGCPASGPNASTFSSGFDNGGPSSPYALGAQDNFYNHGQAADGAWADPAAQATRSQFYSYSYRVEKPKEVTSEESAQASQTAATTLDFRRLTGAPPLFPLLLRHAGRSTAPESGSHNQLRPSMRYGGPGAPTPPPRVSGLSAPGISSVDSSASYAPHSVGQHYEHGLTEDRRGHEPAFGTAAASQQDPEAGSRPWTSLASTGASQTQAPNLVAAASSAEIALSSMAPQLQPVDPFLTEAAADAHLDHAGILVKFTKLAIVVTEDDITSLTGEQKRQIKQRLFDSLLSIDPNTTAPAGVDSAKYAKQQQEALSQCKAWFTRRQGHEHAQACCAKVFFTAERLHTDGIDEVLLDPSGKRSAKRYPIDWTSRFTSRMENVIEAIRSNKRVAVDVLEGKGRDELVHDAASYVQRKLTNCKGNAKRGKASATSGSAQQETASSARQQDTAATSSEGGSGTRLATAPPIPGFELGDSLDFQGLGQGHHDQGFLLGESDYNATNPARFTGEDSTAAGTTGIHYAATMPGALLPGTGEDVGPTGFVWDELSRSFAPAPLQVHGGILQAGLKRKGAGDDEGALDDLVGE